MKREIMVIHRCLCREHPDHRCLDSRGVIVYRGTDEGEAAQHMANAPSGYEAVMEARPKQRKAVKY